MDFGINLPPAPGQKSYWRVTHTCSWFIISLWAKWHFQTQTTSVYQQVIHKMLKAEITTAPLLGESVTIFCMKGKNNLAKITTAAPQWSLWSPSTLGYSVVLHFQSISLPFESWTYQLFNLISCLSRIVKKKLLT